MPMLVNGQPRAAISLYLMSTYTLVSSSQFLFLSAQIVNTRHAADISSL